MSRNPSYYNTYPIATPSTLNGSPPDTSPEVHPVEDPALLGGMVGAASAPMMASGSSSSNYAGIGAGGEDHQRPASRSSRRISSVDRLRMEAATGVRGDRPSSPAPSALYFPSPHAAPYPVPEDSVPEGSVTPPSPPYPYSPSRSSSSPMLSQGGYPRPASMSSLSSRGHNYLHVGPARGAPHQGRPVQLEMPRLLSGGSGDGPTSPLSQSGEWGNKRYSGGMPPVHGRLGPHVADVMC
jgi:hypothetical protein